MYTQIIPQRALPFGNGILTFSVPSKIQHKIHPGQIVEIPLRNQREKGIVFDLQNNAPEFDTVDIGRILTPPLLTQLQLQYVQRISEYYFSSYSKTLALLIPKKLWNSDGLPPTETFLEVHPNFIHLQKNKETELRLSSKQQLILKILAQNNNAIRESDLRTQHQISLGIIKRMLANHILTRTLREPTTPEIAPNFQTFPQLTPEQEHAREQIIRESKSLLFGPANAGKTLVALKCIAQIVKSGKSALYLVPERLLSESLIQTFHQHFPPEICALSHSFLSEGERKKLWWNVKMGHTKIVFGTRSSLFLPFSDLGIIVIDEEHDTSYKSDRTPRYHARTAGEMLADLHGAKLLLQSATPSVETFFRAQNDANTHSKTPKKLQLCTISNRFGKTQNPPIHVADMRHELSAKNYSPFSHLLQQKIQKCLEQKKQILLFLNRRGKHSALVCRQCGTATTCSRCGNRTTLHENKNKNEFLLCHHCSHIDPIPHRCSRCQSTALKGFGMGTQALEHETKLLFPHAKVLRADSDSIARKHSARAIFQSFADGHADILIGTQIITKGLDIPNIGLVGIMLADTSLHLPDFRASERAFQLLTQASGRTARQEANGEIVLQTYLPEHPAVQFCARHDAVGFFDQEIAERSALSLPPFTQIIRLICAHRNQAKARAISEKWMSKLSTKAQTLFPQQSYTISTAPSMTAKKAGKFHYYVFITGKNPAQLLQDERLSGIRVDRDPIESF